MIELQTVSSLKPLEFIDHRVSGRNMFISWVKNSYEIKKTLQNLIQTH